MADNDIHEIKIFKNCLRNLLYRMHYMGKTILDVGGGTGPFPTQRTGK